jgi:hypothetical protein
LNGTITGRARISRMVSVAVMLSSPVRM